MQQISLFDDEKLEFPTSHEDIEKLYKAYIYEDETDTDAFTSSDIKNGKSYFFYGKKVFEFTKDASGKAKLRIQQDNGKPITITSETQDLGSYLTALKETKRDIFRNLTTESFGCCDDFERCSDALKCLHPEDRLFNGCMYRKNLESGKVFYGKNRNV